MTKPKTAARKPAKGRAPKARPASRPAPVAPPRVPPPGPGRPRKPTAPRTDHQVALAHALTIAEAERDAAAAAYGTDTTVAAETRLLRAELGVASAWSSYLRAQGLHVHALRYADVGAKLAGRLAGLRELAAADQLAALIARAGREDTLGKGGPR